MDAAREPDEYTLVDARGHRCPVPTLRLRRALAAAPAGAVIALLADDPLAGLDVPHFAAGAGCIVLDQRREGGVWRFRVRRDASARDGARG
jgi:tRNA 2-thiouridine synthesizing protein A